MHSRMTVHTPQSISTAPADPFTELLPQELTLNVLALTLPRSVVPATSRLLHSTVALAKSTLVQRSWRNRVLLGDGTLDVEDWHTDDVNCHSEYFCTPHLSRSHPLYMLRVRLPSCSLTGYASSPAPTCPPPDPLFSTDYVGYLFSTNGPFARHLTTLARDNSGIEVELDTLWKYHFSWRPRPEMDEEGEHDPLQHQDTTPPEIPSYSWWQGIPNAFQVIAFLIRAGQLEALELALNQLAQHVPNLAHINTRASRWCMLSLDNRLRTRDFFFILCENQSDPSITFSHFVTILALFEWSLSTLQVIARTLQLSNEDIFSAMAHDPIQDYQLRLIGDMTDMDRVMELADWMDHNQAPLTVFPLAHKTLKLSAFERLLFEFDMPRAARQTDPEHALGQVQDAICNFLVRSNQGPRFVPVVVQQGLLSPAKWAHLLAIQVRWNSYYPDRLIAAILELIGDSELWRGALHDAIVLNVTTLTTVTVARTKLLNLVIDCGIDPVDYLLDHASTWKNEQLVSLFCCSPKLAWSRPDALVHALDRLFRDAPTVVTLKCRYFFEIATGTRVHIVCTLFGLCLKAATPASENRSDPSSATTPFVPEWLLDFTHQQIALLIWCHLHVFGALDHGNVLQLATLETVLDILQSAWRSIATISDSDTLAPTLSSALPVPFAHSLFRFARAYSAKAATESFTAFPELAQRAKTMAKLLMDMEPDLVLIAMERDLVSPDITDQFCLDDMAAAALSNVIICMTMLTPVEKIPDLFPTTELQHLPRAKRLLQLRLRVEHPQQDPEVADRMGVVVDLLRDVVV